MGSNGNIHPENKLSTYFQKQFSKVDNVFSRAPEIPLTLKFSRLTKFLHAISRWQLMGIKKNVHVKYQPSWFNTKFYILDLSRTDNLFRRLSGLWKLFHRSPRISRFFQDCMNPVKTDLIWLMKPGHSYQVFSMCKHVLSSYFTAELSQTRTSYKILIQSLWQATSSSKLIAPILSLQMAKVLPSKTQNMGKFLSMVTSSSVEPQAFFHLLGKIYSKFWKDKNKNKKHTHITSERYIQLIEIIHPATSKNISYPKMHCLEQFAVQWWNDLRWPRFYITLLCNCSQNSCYSLNQSGAK